jgi:sensor histidine kinase YesM
VVYAPTLPRALNQVNIAVLVPTLGWSVLQYVLYARRPHLPPWLAIVNPLVDLTAVSVIIGGYAVTDSAALALKSPVFLVYFVVLGARPIASSTRNAAGVAVVAVLEYAGLLAILFAVGRLRFIASPIQAASGAGISLLDECAKLLFLAVAGGIAIYATSWHEQLATRYYRESEEREQMRLRLAQAQIESLKLQLNPHFLFNALNAITALIADDPMGAERMVTGLSEFLRQSLHNAGEQEVPLARELELLRPYLDIQQIRFSDRLRFAVEVEDDTREALVPNLILQPLVENAIRHGIAPLASGGCVAICAYRAGAALHLAVVDDGVGFRAGAPPPRDGVGLGNTRARLAHLYGENHRFALEPTPGGGLTVAIEIPFHTYPAAHASTTEEM